MAKGIPARLILSTVPVGSSPGLYRSNHVDCPAGEDYKRRLYIRVPDDNPRVRLAYCHNCQTDGFAKIRRDSYSKDEYGHVWNPRNAGQAKVVERSHQFGQDRFDPGVVNMDLWPTRASSLLESSGITQALATKYNLAYDGKADRIQYINGDVTNPVSVQYRAIYSSQVPKYFTWYNPKHEQHGQQILQAGESIKLKTVVITEDLISAIRVNEATDYLALPLFGANISTDHLFELYNAHEIERAIVWLDNDSVSICKKAEDIASRVALLGAIPSTVHTKYEPKHTTDGDIVANIAKAITDV